jgi:hypothetical protein
MRNQRSRLGAASFRNLAFLTNTDYRIRELAGSRLCFRVNPTVGSGATGKSGALGAKRKIGSLRQADLS